MLLEKVLETTKYAVEESKEVRIEEEGIEKLAKELKKQKIPPFSGEFYFFGKEKDTIQYFFILDSINFCFFPDKNEKKWGILSGKKKISGFFALSLALKKAIKKYPLLRADFLSNISLKTLREILKGEGGGGTIPLLEKRKEILRETGRVLLKEFNGEAVNILKKANGSCQKLVEILFEKFPSFRDTAPFNKKKIYFLKRAQIFAADIYGIFSGRGFGNFYDIEKLTCFADYKVPQILVDFGILKYSASLLERIKKKEEIKAFSRREIELRANTVWAVEKIKEKLKKEGIKMTSFQIDWILWTMAKKRKMRIPHHRTRTILY